ncbi:M23 family metallopeptidase [uncultured Brachyspira sp.]|uniref:M23 family metallopeptidase n=2 Tax=uncultured Brachyspira sp. TaxID=221953 RepID=UPI0025FE8377|nr:M23 family metallopeptidase [uncultured Brachyspira sp.]
MKYIISIIFFISLSLYPQNEIQFSGNTSVIRDGKKADIKKSDEVLLNDIIETEKNSFAEIKIANKYYYLSPNTKVKISSQNAHLISGAMYTRNNAFDSLEDFKKYDNDIKIYADPFPFYAGKVSTIFIASKDEVKIENAKLLGSARPIVKFFEVKDADRNMKVYKSVFGIYVGSQDEKYQFISDIKLKDKTILNTAIDIKLDFTPPPPKPNQIPGVTSTMRNIISNPQKSKEERELLNGKIYISYTPTNYADKVYIMPSQGRYSSGFGAFRGYTKDYARYHQGFDIANTNGTPIMAANNGIVRVSRELFVRGNCVVIDHGEGVYSSYFHMSKLIAEEGQYVRKGEIIGLIGSTGMSTGPHCHWEMRAGNMTFDPLSILEKPVSFNTKVLTQIK